MAREGAAALALPLAAYWAADYAFPPLAAQSFENSPGNMPGRKRGFGRTFGYGAATKYRRGAGSGFTGRYRGGVGGRFAGRYRRSGYYGRYNNANKGGRGFSELKFHDVFVNQAPIVATWNIMTSWNLIAQNVTETGRVGRKVILRSVTFRGLFSLPEVTAAASFSPADHVRIVIYVDQQTNGANAAVTDLWETAVIHSYRNLAQQSRFKILWDKRVLLNYGAGAMIAGPAVYSPEVFRFVHWNKKLNLPIQFNNTTGAIGEIRSNNLCVALCSQRGTVGLIDGRVRIRFEG